MTSIPQTNGARIGFAAHAIEYARNGWAVVPVYRPIIKGDSVICSCREKAECDGIGKHPIEGKNSAGMGGYKKATNDIAELESNGWLEYYEDANIGVHLGRASANLVDIDVDNRTAESIAYLFLPDTRTFGHGDRPFSHRLYYADDLPEEGVTPYPDIRPSHRPKKGEKGRNVLEVRAGEMTVFPGSVHKSGEAIEWTKPIEIATIASDYLMGRCGMLAATALLIEHNKTDLRHSVAVTLGGWFASVAYPLEDAVCIIRAMASVREKDGANDSERAVRDSYEKFANGEAIAGYSELTKEYYSRNIVDKVREWLGIGKRLARADRALILIDDIQTTEDNGIPTEAGIVPCTHAWSAMLFRNKYRGEVLYCVEEKDWYIWNEKYWQKDIRFLIYELAKTIRTDIIEYAKSCEGSMRQMLAEWGMRMSMNGALDDMLTEALKVNPEMKVNRKSFNTHPHLINVASGTYNLDTQSIQDPRKEDLLTYHTDTDVIDDGVLPLVVQMSAHAIGNAYSLRALQIGLGTGTSGDTEKAFYLLIGATDTGKTTLLNTCRIALGTDYSEQMPQEAITKKLYRKQELWAAMVHGKRYVQVSETAKGDEMDIATMKALTGGIAQTAKLLYQNPFTSEPTYTIFIDTNYRPKAMGSSGDDAFWNRAKIINFVRNVKFAKSDERYIENFDDLIQTPLELGRVLAWLVKGYTIWKTEGIAESDEMKRSKDEYRDAEDIIAEFVYANLISCPDNPKALVGIDSVRRRFREWAWDIYRGSYPEPDWADFNKQLETRWGFARTDQAVRVDGKVQKAWRYMALSNEELGFTPYSERRDPMEMFP